MNGKKLIILVVFTFICALSFGLLVGCSEDGDGLETQVKYTWSYSKEFVDEHDADMRIDGVLDEEAWQGQAYLYHKEKNVSMKYTTVFTSYGLYIGAVVEDSHLVWTGRFNFFGPYVDDANNSAFMFKVQGADVKAQHATTVFNFFVDSKNSASRNQTHFEAKATVNGDIDLGQADEMVAELFVSWKALNIDVPEDKDYPDYVRIQPLYRYVEEIDSANNKWLTPLFSEYSDGRLLHRSRFSSKGYINADKADAVLGDALNGISKSDGWDLSQLSNGKVISDTYHGQAIFFKNICSDSYVYSTTFKVSDPSIANWQGNVCDGHGGVCDMIDSEYFNAFYIAGWSLQPGVKELNYFTLNFIRGDTYSNWNEYHEGSYKVPEGVDAYNDGVRITVIKQKDKFFYYIYDDLVLCKEIRALEGATCPGLYALSRCIEFSDYSVKDYSNAQTELDELIYRDAYKVSSPGSVSGGVVGSASCALIKNNGVCTEDLVLTVTPNAGYILTSLNISGTTSDDDYLGYFVENCKDGILTIDKSTIIDNVSVTAKYTYLTRCDLYDTQIIKLSGELKDGQGKAFSAVNVYLKNSNATFCYKLATSGKGTFSFSVPREGALRLPEGGEMTTDGRYTLYINIAGYRVISEDIYLDRDWSEPVQFSYVMAKTTVGGSTIIDDATLRSDSVDWDYSHDDRSVVTTTKKPNATAYFTDVATKGGAIVQATVSNLTDTSLAVYEKEPGIGFVVNNSWKMVKFILAGSKLKILRDGSWNDVVTYSSEVAFNTRVGNGENEYTIRLVHERSSFVFQILDGDEWVSLCYYTDYSFDTVCSYGLTATSGNPVCVEFKDYSATIDEQSRPLINELFYTPFKVTINYYDGTSEIIDAKFGEGLLTEPTKSLEPFAHNGLVIAPNVGGNTVELTDKYFKSLMGDTVISFGYDTSGVIAYDEDNEILYTTGSGEAGKGYSFAKVADTVSGDFELSMDVKHSKASWPVEVISIIDGKGQSIQFLAGRIYVGCQANGAWDNMGEGEDHSNVYWLRNQNGWSNNYMGTCLDSATDTYTFNFKVVVLDGVATIFVDKKYCGIFNLANNYPNFDLSGTITVKIGFRDVNLYNGGYIHLSNWSFADEVVVKDSVNITIEYPDGTSQEIVKKDNALSAEPLRGYDYSSDNGVKVVPKVDGATIALTEEYLMSLIDDTVVTYSEVKTGNGVLSYNAEENRMQVTSESNGYSQVVMANTVTSDFELSMKVHYKDASWPVEAVSVHDGKGHTIQFIAGRIYIGCQANWSWVNMGENDGHSNAYWLRDQHGWSHNNMGTCVGTDEYEFNFKVVVSSGIATIYVDEFECGTFDLSVINPDFDFSAAISVELCVKDVYLNESGYIYLSNWVITDTIEG